ncbi:NAD(P)-dependent oxidoreductase [Acidovorax sp. SUPP2522]|uniref:NAD(P)-dependent oxidoreductase n=1 Tax=unclassified Acidovorax TaxID=2684926 RepID=UPI002349D921|nr:MULTISPECIES: NAD(P)-dependent oxidoreductase [unclassified Acidovorax]WCM98756.1 NAD(P)-dependent oxidoreductase [Acidovorax sp. GBBC 1281]GKT17850.1 NAD(P)-dependent oxidoreductase [Acidovorax sp. SUPP2522]
METTANRACGIHAARLNLADYAVNFGDAHPPLTKAQALVEAERCYYCFDAPCATACPTGIDIPAFIHRVAQGNDRGAARAILEANPLGGMCARVCPTEVLCEQACVRNSHDDKPVEIGALQRRATDAYFADPGAPLFTRAAPTGRRVAVVGAGPAGLACAHGLAVRGHDVVLFEARPKLGGLNEYGLASYKTTGGFAQKEIEWLLSIGGIEVRCNQVLGRDATVDSLLQAYDAVFLGLGLAGVNALGIAEPQVEGLCNAVDFIADVRQAQDLSTVPVGRRVVVIGGGMTAVDAAVQARKLGAEEVTIVYRRSADGMSASAVEQRWAQTNGVAIRHWAAPKELLSEGGVVRGMRFAATALAGGRLVDTGEAFTLEADMVLKAIGQSYLPEHAGPTVALQGGRIATDDMGRTSVARLWAGGDCRAGGRDLTVEAVEHGKVSALSISEALRG